MRDRRAVLLLIASFAIAVIVVDPRGNFPLDDDWGVGFTTFTLVHSGHFELTPFASATAYLQFVWGALWAALFGETFTVLRLSVLALSLASTLTLYALLRRAGAAVPLALFGAAALLFHPLFFWASFTSMTHVPFVFMSVASAYAFVRAWEDERVWLAIALLVTVASFFTRQFAVLNAIAPLVVALLARRKKLAIVYGIAVAVFIALVLSGVLVGSQKELVLHRPTLARVATRGVHYVFFHWQNIALFFAPVLLLVRGRLSRVAMAVAAIAFAYPCWRMTWQVRMPIPYMNSGNVFTNFGLGPPTLRDVFTLGMPHPFALPWDVRVALMIVTAIGGVVAAGLVVAAFRISAPIVRFAVVYLACGTAIVMAMGIYFDRYSIDTAWPFVLLLALGARRIKAPAAILLAIAIVFSICGTAEYLAWNRARWTAYADLRAHGVTLEQMDGGYEINSMLALRAGRKDLGKAGVGVVDDLYVIAFNRIPGYVTLRSYPYPRWLGLSRGWLHVERRAAPRPQSPRPATRGEGQGEGPP